MTPTYGVDEFMQAADRQRNELLAQQGRLETLRAQHASRRSEVKARLDEAAGDLSGALLPDLSPASIQGAVRRTGYMALGAEDPAVKMEADRRSLTARLAMGEKDPRYQNRELLRAPRTGTLTRQLDELMDFRSSLVQSMESCDHPRLERLLAEGYDTPDYKVGWWRSSYYGDRSAAKEILSRFPGKKRFDEVREEYVRARDTLVVYDQKIGELQREIRDGEALEQVVEEDRAALSDLPARHLQSLREKLLAYLGDMDAAAIADRLKDEPDLQGALKRWDGLRHKVEYLDQLSEKQLGETEQKIWKEQQKLERDVMKYSRPKNQNARFPAGDFERRFQDRPRHYWSSMDRYERAYDTIYVYDRYERASLVENFLWWDLMTGGRINGRFIPAVDDHYRSYPDYHFDRSAFSDDRTFDRTFDGDHQEDAAAAASIAGEGAGQSLPDDAIMSTPDAFSDIS